MNQYLVELECNDEKIVCIPRETGTDGLGLDEKGITWEDKNAPVRLEMNDNEMNIVKGENDVEAILERNGRKRVLQSGKSMRLLANDRIWLGSVAVRVSNLFKSSSNRVREAVQSMKGASKIAMLVLASSLIVAIPSCDTSDEEKDDVAAGVCSDKTDIAQRKACCEAITDSKDRTACCDALTKADSNFVCEDARNINEIEDGELKEEWELCNDYSELADRKSCCESLEYDEQRTKCCDALAEANTEFVCEKTQIIDEPLAGALVLEQGPCEEFSDLGERKACCEALENADAKSACCDALAKVDSTFACEIVPIIDEPLAGEPELEQGPCEEFSDLGERKACCEALEDGDAKSACCDLLAAENSEFVCEEAPIIGEPTSGVLPPEDFGEVIVPDEPCRGETGKDLKLCCETLTVETDKVACCKRLDSENSGFACE